MDLCSLSITEARQRLGRREISSVELTQAVLRRIQDVDERVHAYITVTEETALAAAERADRLLSEGVDAPLLGVPIAVKDNICTRDAPTTCASRMLTDFRPAYDATVVGKLRDAGAVIVGKTNLDEFAMGSSTEFSAFGPTRNPYDLDRVPGGSSGGSAAAVAAGEALGALGSDTGGSIRLPASFCGVVGLKPTYGRVSRYGLVAYASSLDQIGPFAGDVQGCAELLSVIAGHDPMDATSLDWPVGDYAASLSTDVKGLRIGVPDEYFGAGLDPAVESVVRSAIRQLESAGAEVLPVSLPHTKYALAAYYVIAPAEASANLSRYDGVKYGLSEDGADIWEAFAATRGKGFGIEVKRRIMIGTYALSAGYYDAYYLKAQRARTLIKQDFDRAFEKVDLLAGPTAPTVAFKIGEKMADPVSMYLTDIFTVTVNTAGLPALVVPCGLAHAMPVGLQLIGPAGSEGRLLNAGYAYEQLTAQAEWRACRPLMTAENAEIAEEN